MRHPILLFGLIAVLAGCGNDIAEREARLRPLVGQNEKAVIEAMGVPSRSYETGGSRYLAYVERRVEVVPGMSGCGGFGGWPYGFCGGGIPPQVVERRCETTFEIGADGLVRTFTLRGNAC
jgi:hypothetical protein